MDSRLLLWIISYKCFDHFCVDFGCVLTQTHTHDTHDTHDTHNTHDAHNTHDTHETHETHNTQDTLNTHDTHDTPDTQEYDMIRRRGNESIDR